jgi:hypothetical protein
MHPRPFASLQDERRLSLSGARFSFVAKLRSRASPGAPRVLTPLASMAGGAFTAIDPYSDAPCRFPGTAASAPAARQLLAVPARFTGHASRRLTRSARTPRCCTGEGATPERPGRLPSCHWMRQHSARIGKITLRTTHTSSPCARQNPRQRSSGFLPASSPVDGLPCGSPTRTTQDASDRLLLSITLSTSTRASSVPALAHQFYPVACGERGASRHLSRFGGPRALFRCGAFSSPRRGAWPYL